MDRIQRVLAAASVALVATVWMTACSEEPNTFTPEGGASPYAQTGVDLSALGNDLWTDGSYWTPSVDFSQGQAFYFDPTAQVSGDGALASPFRAFGIEAISGTIIQRRDDGGTIVNPTAPVAEGDVCVLLGGNHGIVRLDEYVNNDYIGIVGMPGETAQFEFMLLRDCEKFFIQGLTAVETLRGDWPDPPQGGNWPTDGWPTYGTGFDDGPFFIQVLPDKNATQWSEDIIIKDCVLRTASMTTADGWSDVGAGSDWYANAVGGIFTDRVDYVHIQGNLCEVVNYGVVPRWGEYINLRKNTVRYNCGDGFKIRGPKYAHIANNFLVDFFPVDGVDPYVNHVDMIQVVGANPNGQTQYVKIERNRCFESSDGSRMLEGIFAGIQFSQGDHDPTRFMDIDVFDNIVYMNRFGGIISNAATRMSIYNNTVISANRANESFPSATWIDFLEEETAGVVLDCDIVNNITGGAPVSGDFMGNVTIAGNSRYGRDFTGAGFTNWVVNGPPLDQNVLLLKTSVNKDAGDLGLYAPYDFDHLLRNDGAPDRGAYEWKRFRPTEFPL
ncbi:MAG: right-handed parallel beta-helix repeat-containing protein [Candidatus Eisenbacteria bacterium]|nr:right-handed parallel beta-helix repeat-containing protein [Candidatus Eisenbacteria bacterium]